MRDLLTDIAGPESSENDMFNLANLEKELDAKSGGNTNASSSAPPPPGMAHASAGAMVVGHGGAPTPTGTRMMPPHPSTPVSTDAFAASLQQFSALSLTEDFLKADSARKEQSQINNKVGEMISNDLVNNLFEGEEDYDIQEDAVLNAAGSDKAMAQLFPGFGKQQGVSISKAANANAAARPSSQQSAGGARNANVNANANTNVNVKPIPQPPMGGVPPPPPPHMNMRGSNGGPPPPNMMPGMGMPQSRGPPPPNMMPGQGMPQSQPQQPHHLPPGSMPMPPPHHMMRGPMPPHMMGPPMNMPPGAMPPGGMPPGGMPPGGMPPGGMPPPHVMMMMQQQMQQQQIQQHQQRQMQQQAQAQQQQMQQQAQQQAQKQQQQAKVQEKVQEKKVFKKMDFPALGANASEIEKERIEEETIEKANQAKKAKAKAAAPPNNRRGPNPSHEHVIRYTFHNPSPTATPVPATAIKCTSMTSRDLCYVLHSMLRPILSFASVLDAYNADYYRWSYDDRKSRNLLFLGGNAPSSGNNLPNPVWKETKVKAQKMEDKFRDSVEKRADAWTKDKQTLGRVVKVNVKRPRALLSTTALTTNVESKVDLDAPETDTEEDRQRAILWAARVAIDKGFQAYLSLVELRRLLQSRPGDALNGEESVINRREQLLKDVQENVDKLHGAFGLKKIGDSADIECDDKILGRTLTLPKGRMLLSRVIDEGILPHPSACKVLPNAIKVVFVSASTADLSIAPPAGEDRLLRSLTGLVKTTQPSVDPNNLLSCLNSTINAENIINGEKRSMKSVLSSKRTLTELLFAVFSRGGEVCVGGFLAEWKDKESKFLAILSSS